MRKCANESAACSFFCIAMTRACAIDAVLCARLRSAASERSSRSFDDRRSRFTAFSFIVSSRVRRRVPNSVRALLTAASRDLVTTDSSFSSCAMRPSASSSLRSLSAALSSGDMPRSFSTSSRSRTRSPARTTSSLRALFCRSRSYLSLANLLASARATRSSSRCILSRRSATSFDPWSRLKCFSRSRRFRCSILFSFLSSSKLASACLALTSSAPSLSKSMASTRSRKLCASLLYCRALCSALLSSTCKSLGGTALL